MGIKWASFMAEMHHLIWSGGNTQISALLRLDVCTHVSTAAVDIRVTRIVRYRNHVFLVLFAKRTCA